MDRIKPVQTLDSIIEQVDDANNATTSRDSLYKLQEIVNSKVNTYELFQVCQNYTAFLTALGIKAVNVKSKKSLELIGEIKVDLNPANWEMCHKDFSSFLEDVFTTSDSKFLELRLTQILKFSLSPIEPTDLAYCRELFNQKGGFIALDNLITQHSNFSNLKVLRDDLYLKYNGRIAKGCDFIMGIPLKLAAKRWPNLFEL